MADFGGEIETFRAEVRDWLEANFPKELAKDPNAQLAKLQARPETPAALTMISRCPQVSRRREMA